MLANGGIVVTATSNQMLKEIENSNNLKQQSSLQLTSGNNNRT